MEGSNLQTEAAKIIQRNFRIHLNRKRQLQILRTSPKLEKCSLQDSKEEKVKYSEEVWKVRSSLKSFYKKIVENPDRCKYVNDLIRETDKISNRLRQFKSLDTFESGSIKISGDDYIYNEAKRRHDEKLKEFQLQWWEKLTLSDSV